MGLDINADHLALALIDRHGNPLNKWTIPCHTFGKTSEQHQAVIGDACKQVVELAKQAGVPLVMENLSFRKKKDELEKSHSARYARMQSFWPLPGCVFYANSGYSAAQSFWLVQSAYFQDSRPDTGFPVFST